MSGTEYLLTFDGCPYGFGTAGCPTSITSTDSDWSSNWTIVADFLQPPRGSISERLATSDSQLQVGGLTFKLNDHPASTGPYAGVDRLCSYLFSRRPSQIAHAALASPGFTTGDASFTLALTNGFGSGSIRVWIDQECLSVTRSGTTCTINTSGYYGSRATNHQTDDSRGFRPVVWSAFPGIARRRCVLWVVRDGVATPRWRGRVTPGPSISQDDEDGGEVFVVPCEHVWVAAKEGPVGIEPKTARVIGYPQLIGDGTANDAALTQVSVMRVEVVQGTKRASTSTGYTAHATLDELLTFLANSIREFMVTNTFDEPAQFWFERDEQDKIRAVLLGPTTADLSINITVNGTGGSRLFESKGQKDSGSTRRAELSIDGVPSVWVPGLANSAVSRTLLLDDASGLPTSSGKTTTTILPSTVIVQRALRGKINDNWNLVLESFAVTVADSTVGGYMRVEPRRPELRGYRGVVAIAEPVELRACGQVIADHWAYGLRYGLLGSTGSRLLRTPADPRDWTWDLESRVIAATAGPRSLVAVRWYFDGSEKLGDTITDLARLNGCAVCVRAGGRLSIAPLRPPLPTDAVSATLTEDDYLEPPAYETLPEGISNSAKIEGDTLNLTVNQLDSEGRYGVARQVSLKLVGKSDVAPVHTPTPAALALQLLRFVLGTWAEPTELHRLVVSADAFDEVIYTGDVIEFDSDVAPDGSGGRGLTAQRGLVIGRDTDLFDDDRLVLEVLTFPTRENLRAFSPCVRIAAISGDTITVDTAYLSLSDGATDYAGSNLTGYRKTANDGGAGWFELGYICTIRAVDTRSVSEQTGLEIESVSGTTITLTASIPTTVRDWAAFVSGGGLAELVFTTYDAATDAQRKFAYIGDESEELIDGMDPMHRLGP